VDGYQVEVPDYWLDFNPWEFPRHDIVVDVSTTLVASGR
jgi:starch phosphorylase